MKIESALGPSLSNPNTTQSPSQNAARERAIQALSGTLDQLKQSPQVRDSNQVAPEELRAVSSPARQSDVIEEPLLEKPVAPKEPEEPLSSQYAVLARKEKALRLRDQQLRQREAALKAPVEAPKPSFDESKYVAKDRLSQDPFAVLNEMGLDYEKLTNMVLNGPSPDQRTQVEYVKKLEARLEALEGTTAKTSKLFEERDTQARSHAVSQIKHEVTKLVTSDPTYEAIAATKSIGDVVELIERTFDEDGILMTVEEAAQQVEDYLVDEALKISKIKKIQQRLQPRETAPQAPATGRPQQPQMKTLTNSLGTSKKLSNRDRAIAVFKGELK